MEIRFTNFVFKSLFCGFLQDIFTILKVNSRILEIFCRNCNKNLYLSAILLIFLDGTNLISLANFIAKWSGHPDYRRGRDRPSGGRRVKEGIGGGRSMDRSRKPAISWWQWPSFQNNSGLLHFTKMVKNWIPIIVKCNCAQ